MEGRRNLRSALRMFSTGADLARTMKECLAQEPGLPQFVRDAFNQHIARDEEQRPSFEAHVTTSLQAWNNRLVADVTSRSDFDIRELRRNPFSLFIAAPVSDFGSVEPLIRLLVQQIHDVMLRNLPDPKTEPYKVAVLLDEFYQFERIPEIVKRTPLVAGYGFQIGVAAQNVPQIDDRYSKSAREALLGNMDVKLIVAVGDDATGRVVSETLGKRYEERHGWGTSAGGAGFGRRSTQGRWEAVPLMASDQLQRLDKRECVLTIQGHSSARLKKLNFYTDRRFVQRRAEVKRFEPLLAIPKVAEVEEWPLFIRRPPFPQALGAPVAGRDSKSEIASLAHLQAMAAVVFAEPKSFIDAVRDALADVEKPAIVSILKGLREKPSQFGKLRRGTSAAAGVGPLRDRVLREARAVRKAAQAVREAEVKAIVSEENAPAREKSNDLAAERAQKTLNETRAAPAPIDRSAVGGDQGAALPGWDVVLQDLKGVHSDVQTAVFEVKRRAVSEEARQEVNSVWTAASAAMAAFMEEGAGRRVFE